MKAEAEKKLKEAVDYKAKLIAELQEARNATAGWQNKFEAMASEWDWFNAQITKLKKERGGDNLKAVQALVDKECKDKSIYHLAFQLNPHLDLLLSKVADRIGSMPHEIGVVVTLTNQHTPKPVVDVEVSLASPSKGKHGETSVVNS